MLFAWISLLATLSANMTPQEIEQTGIAKLSGQEQGALQSWIDERYKKRAQTKKKPGPILQENLQNGRYIGLSDQSIWEIHPADTPITQGWITAVEIKAEPSGDEKYPYKLTNSLTGSSVKARR